MRSTNGEVPYRAIYDTGREVGFGIIRSSGGVERMTKIRVLMAT